ncbi:MAG TPA: FixH family protein [Hyphomicrobium sp.]|nr:FixH family protein [Hyphomicrobium sp.]
MSTSAKGSSAGLRGSHVLMILAGFFAIIVTVDGFMIYQAVTTFGGLETDAYRRGLAYNERIEQETEQTTKGWHDEISVAGTPARLRVGLTDVAKDGVPGRRLIARVGRPATDRFDRTVELVETGAGVYEAELGELIGGSWIVDLSAFDGADSAVPFYQVRRRIWIGP